jgi:hypothetical protein
MIEKLDSLFVSKNWFSKFLPMITENSHLQVSMSISGIQDDSREIYIDGIPGKYVVSNSNLMSQFEQFYNEKIAEVELLVTEVNLPTLREIFGDNYYLCLGDVVCICVELIFSKEVMKEFVVTFPNHFEKKYTSVVSLNDKYQNLISTTFKKECEYMPVSSGSKKTTVVAMIHFEQLHLQVPVIVTTFNKKAYTSSNLRISFDTKTAMYNFVGKDSKVITMVGIDESVVAELKLSRLPIKGSFKKQSVYKRMKKYYGE